MILYQLSVFLHILSAIVWIGGMLFLPLVVVPATRGLPSAERAALFGVVGRRFRDSRLDQYHGPDRHRDDQQRLPRGDLGEPLHGRALG